VKCGVTTELRGLDFSEELLQCDTSSSLRADTLVMISLEITVNGITNAEGSVLVWKWLSMCESEFVEVHSPRATMCKKLEIVEFSAHFNSFIVTDASERSSASGSAS